LVLSARPDSPGLWWKRTGKITELPVPVWSHHLEGAEVMDLLQPGADRILHICLKSGLLYGNSDVTLIFEITGRNANVILLRSEDNRILACHRKVSSRMNRYRTVAPGQVYVPPPSSGLSPGSWSSSIELRISIEECNDSPELLYKILEGVGPVTARALIRHSEISKKPLLEMVAELEKALLEHDFNPWEGPDGLLPIELGEGKPILDPLSLRISWESATTRNDGLEIWTAVLRRRLSFLRRRLSGVITAMDRLVSPEKYRTWGSLLLSAGDNSRKGLKEIELKDWNGCEHIIPLKPFRSLKSNAARFFRKASNTGKEKHNLEEHKRNALKEIESLEKSLSAASDLTVEELEACLRNHRKIVRDQDDRRRRIEAKVLSSDWRCFAGRNARENEEVTFRIGKRGDLWFHARGYPGAHVVLKLDGRADNPPGEIILEAAVEAAKSSGVSSGVIPVDYTRVQYVNRRRKGKPGQVVYTREKTVFVDLDKLS
ncbi:MAG: NFACT RNA binding domain-containing protein, partial [Candidatus Aegiribacteria sp.]|nr:NFACT RNA binding domain-containing protein [Candidatus Aegiribacteria sp.]